MTLKQKLFANKYIETGNGTQSALDVYNTNKPNVAAQIAYENLRKPQIISEIDSYFERRRFPSESVAKALVDVINNGNPSDKLKALIICLRMHRVR